MTPSFPKAGCRAAVLVSLLATLLLSACENGVGEGNTLASLTITDASGVQPTGPVEVFQCLPSRLFLIGTFDDGSRDTTIGLRQGVTWTSSNSALAQVSNGDITIDGITHPKGTLLVTGLATSDVDQTATISASFLGLSASQTVVVRGGTLEVSPTRQTIAKDTAIQMIATAIFGQLGAQDSAGTNLAADFRDFVNWTSSNASIPIDESGIVTGSGEGETTIRAITGAPCDNTDAQTTVTVLGAPTSVALAPALPASQFSFADMDFSTSVIARLIATFSDGVRRQDLTAAGQATLAESGAGLLSFERNVRVTSGTTGGNTSLVGSYSGLQATQPVTVADRSGSLTSISLCRADRQDLGTCPAGPFLMLKNTTLELDAIGDYSAGTKQNLYRSPGVSWSEPTDSAAISVTFDAGIVIPALDTTGEGTVTAIRSAVSVVPASVKVLGAPDSNQLTVACTPNPVPVNRTSSCRAYASLNDGTTTQVQDIGLFAVWSSSDPTTAEVSNARIIDLAQNVVVRRNELGELLPLPGRIYAVADGSAQIRASLFDSDGAFFATGVTNITTTSGPLDTDNDGVPDASDNCPTTGPADQTDTDGDGEGDVCDTDIDGDGVSNTAPDQCPNTPAAERAMVNAQGCGPSERDTDGDGITDDIDQCVTPSGEVVDDTGCPCTVPPIIGNVCLVP